MASLKRLGGLFLIALSITLPAEASPSPEKAKQGALKLEEGLFIGFLWPLRGTTSSPYGQRIDPISSDITAHHGGLDIAAPAGSWAAASKAGRVVHAGPSGGYGNLVTVRHTNETETRYGHLGELHVKKGAFVRPGQRLGLVGNTGRATGYHLHFEVRVKGRSVNPVKWLVPYGFMMPPANADKRK